MATLMQANGNIWHNKQMETGELPKCGNVDTEAHGGVNGGGEWTFGYRLHCLSLCGVEGITWPATASVHSGNIKDAQVFEDELSSQLPPTTKVALGVLRTSDGGYAQESCFATCEANQTTLIAPIKVKKTLHLSASNKPCSIKTPTFEKSLPSEKPLLNPCRDNSKNALGLNACLSRVWPMFAPHAIFLP